MTPRGIPLESQKSAPEQCMHVKPAILTTDKTMLCDDRPLLSIQTPAQRQTP